MLGAALRDSGLSLSDLTALARAADDSGYEAIWSPEVGSRDAITLSALYGAQTTRATVGTGVVPVFSRTVTSLALSASAAAEASGGRFVLGLGAGHRFPAEAWFQAEWSRPRVRLRETIEVLRRIFSGERVSHSGAFQIAGFHLGSKPPPIPMYVGALTPATLRMAGEVADGVILNWLPPEGIEKAALLAREAAADAGRTVKVIAYVRTAVIDDDAQRHDARVALREQTYAYLSLPNYGSSVRTAGYGKELDEMSAGRERAIDALVDALCAFGDAARAGARLDAYRSAGLDGVVVYPVGYGDAPAESILRTLRACAP